MKWQSAIVVLLAGTPLWAAIHVVKPGSSIQKAVDKAQPGDTVQVWPGEYKESVVVDKPKIKLQGVIKDGKWPILNGENTKNDGVIASGSGFHIENFHIHHYKGNGVMTQAADDVVIRHLIVADTGIYGIYPTRGNNVLVEDTVSWGIADAAIYIGMCNYVDVRRNEVFQNVAGIEIENSHHVLVEENLAHNNSGGILVFTLPGLPVKTGDDVILRRNFVVNNNLANFGAPGSLVASVPPGSGIILLAADGVKIEDNIIRENKSGGIIFTDLTYMDSSTAPDADTDPSFDNNQVLGNLFFHNGYSPDNKVRLLLIATKFAFKGADVMATGKGKKNCIQAGGRASHVGLKEFGACPTNATTNSLTSMYAQKAPVSYEKKKMEPGEQVYVAVCSGCHVKGLRRVGPAVEEIQKKYAGNPQGIADFAFYPKKVRSDYPAMPSQGHLGRAKLKAVAEYLLEN